MRRVTLVSVWFFFLFVSLNPSASAHLPEATLLPGSRADYRFDYKGDGSQIRVALDTFDASAVSLSVYTPDQIDFMRKGQSPSPIGRGTPNRDHTLFWAGGFRVQGVYHAIVENRSSYAITFRIDIAGDSVSAVSLVQPPATPAPSGTISQGGIRYLVVTLPIASNPRLRLAMPAMPASCTHASQIPATISTSIRLCPNEIYPPLNVVGSNIGIFSDDAHTSVVASAGRQFAITIQGNANWVEGVTIQAQADKQDAGAWLCLYDECVFPTRPQPTTLRGGIRYGGGILLRGSNSVIHGITVRGGTIGIATLDGRSNYIVDNQLSDLNGWGSFNVNSVGSYYVGNTLNRNNHGCTTPDGRKFLHGCETSGWVCLGCQANYIVRNHCEKSANCYYMSGERGLGSNDNRLIANYCAGATDNCFEITFGQRNILEDNVSTVDTKTDSPCKYPFWIGGSVVYFKDNTWQCSISPDDALSQARDSTVVATNIVNINQWNPLPGAPAVAATPKRTRVLPHWGLDFVE